MKLPTTIDELLSEWSTDSTINELDIKGELIKIGNLKAKYLKAMSHHNLRVKVLEKEYNSMRKMKWEYFSGDLNNPQDLQTYGLEPWSKKVLRQDIQMYIDADKDIANLLLKKASNLEIVETCKEIIKELNNRTFQLRAYIDYKKFLEGM